jgi:hypothetical protein
MHIKTALSNKDSAEASVKELAEELAALDPKLVLFFASTKYAPDTICGLMQDAFPKSAVFGCSTAGEIVSGQMLNNSIVAMAFSAQAIKDLDIQIVENLQDEQALTNAFGAFENHFKTPMAEIDPAEHVGIILIDGLSGAEEGFIENVGDLTNVTFIGGSAGDDLKFTATHVYANGKSYQNAAILALLKPGVDFTFIKTQSFRDLGKPLEVTKADELNREVLEFNGQPAAASYAAAIGTSIDKAPEHFIQNPIGLVIDDEPYVRSPQQIKGSSIIFYCSVMEGMELSLLESTDMIKDTRIAIDQAAEELGGVSGIINFNCILRTLELTDKNLTQDYGNLFGAVPTIGFSTYGEQYLGHINQTATMLVFK